MTITVYPYDPATAPPVPAVASDGTTDALSIAVDIYKFYRVKRTASEVVSNCEGILNKRYCCGPDEYVSRSLDNKKRVRNDYSSPGIAGFIRRIDDDDAPTVKRARFNPYESFLGVDENPNTISHSSPAFADNESSEDEDDDSYYFLPERTAEEEGNNNDDSSLAYSFSSNSQDDDYTNKEDESVDDFYSVCSSEVEDDNDNGNDGIDDDTEDNDFQYDYNDEDKEDELSLGGEVVNGQQYYECANIEEAEEVQNNVKNPQVPFISNKNENNTMTMSHSSSPADNESSAEDDDSRYFFPARENEEDHDDSSLAYFSSSSTNSWGVNNTHEEKDESEEEGDFYSIISSGSTRIIACSSEVEDNCDNDNNNDEDVDFQYGSNHDEDSDDSSLAGEVLVADGEKELYCETGDKNEAKNQHQGNTKYSAQVPSIVTIGILGHDIDEEYSQEGEDMYGRQEKENVSFFEVEEQPEYYVDEANERYGRQEKENVSFFEVKEQPECYVDEADEREPEHPCPDPSTASTELLGLDRVFNDLGHVLRMSSHRLRELPRINYKE